MAPRHRERAGAGRGLRPARIDEPVGGRAGVATIEPQPRRDLLECNPVSGSIVIPSHRKLGETGITVHPIALGGRTFGPTLGADDAYAVLDRFAGTGGTLLVTADGHAAGRSETVVGSWMASRGTRERVRIMTRVDRHPEHRALGPVDVRVAVEESLARLGTDRIDVLVFHGDDPRVPLEESLGAVDALIAAGKVRAIGASDFPPERLIEARVLAANGLPRFELLTTRYNLMERRSFEGVTELVAHAQGLAVLPESALAAGFLAGAIRHRSDLRRDARDERVAKLGRRGHRVLDVLDGIAEAHRVAPATIALAWLLAKRTVVAPVASVTGPDQVEAVLAAASVALHRSDLVDLDRASA